MFRTTRLIAITTLLLVASCAGDDGGGGTGTKVDAKPIVRIDAAAPKIDAMGATTFDAAGGVAMGLGLPCDSMGLTCPTGSSCVTLDGDVMGGFCTIPCMGQMDTTTCAAAYSGGVGVAACRLTNPMDMTSWCAIVCDGVPGTNGMCPTGLTCAMNMLCDK